ncbi:MAG: fibronectin type III-like domain-contianing protein, partial [Oscillospiraceae bacterium]|nr:fibronectin type III-like domain-contianing protein [Oscillospiraceae bacterium]
KLALYGSGARRTVQGGTGSGEVNSRGFVTAEDGLEAAGFTVTSKAWLDAYGQLWPEARKRFLRSLKREAWKRGTLAVLSGMGAVMPEPDYALPLDADGEAAIYVLSRSSGEGSDRKPIPGDILLTKTEQRDILALDRKFKRFLLVLNVGGVVDLSPVFAVRNILLLSQLGTETGHILADLVRGKAAPSGKLATTWTAWGDYSAVGTFGDRDDTRYKESVYVGYRYFDRVGKQPLFPFGFGLSFTDFSLEAGNISAAAGTLTVETSVRNTGHRPGKEVVQLYVSPPQGKLDKPYQSLAAFGKTETLQPGAKQSLALRFDLRDLASYDASRASWVLEPGDYVLRLGRSSADTRPIALLRLDGEAVLRKCRNCLGMPDFTDWKPDLKQAEAPAGLPILPLSASAFRIETTDYALAQEIDPITERLSDEELCLLNIGSFRRKDARRVVGDSSTSVAGAAGETCSALTGKGIPSIVMADGPAGLRLSRRYTKDETGAHALDGGMPESMRELMPAPVAFVMKQMGRNKKVKGEVLEQNCTAIPIATALAQSWNLDFARQCGELVGEEMARFGVQLWLAPALNLHRDIRCGRNFEYYSEDPLLSGKFAAAVTRGVQRHPGCGATVKHFAANNQETRRYSSNSQVSERALRELYLRSFEIAVRESRPCALMTSYNLINGTHSSERRDLIEDVLRAEFGFQGIVMSDWITAVVNGKGNKYPAPNAARIAAAGGDLIMPGCMGDLKALRKGLKDGFVTRRQLQINATRVIRMAQRLTGTRPG